jgi:hypothetical protein
VDPENDHGKLFSVALEDLMKRDSIDLLHPGIMHLMLGSATRYVHSRSNQRRQASGLLWKSSSFIFGTV